MFNAFRISFSLKNTYRVNSILYAIKQLPLIKRLLPNSLYASRGLKTFANVLSAIWEVISTFLGKGIYLLAMVFGLGLLYQDVPQGDLFGHMLLFLTAIGAYMNTYMFNPTNDKYYAMVLMRMDARAYTLSNYTYAMLKVVIGFLPLALWVGTMQGAPLWVCLLIPFFVAGAKLIAAWLFLLRYARTGEAVNENLPPKIAWPLAGVLLLAAYGLPLLSIVVPAAVFGGVAIAIVLAGVYAAIKIARFKEYRAMYQLILADKKTGLDYKKTVQQATQEASRKSISADIHITSHKKGFEYFNELFVKRHRKVLWRPAKRVAAIALACVAGLLLAFKLNPEISQKTNELLMSFLPYFAFIMYMINRGTSFTQALFMNCDHSMLSYAFYKRPDFILKLFRIRLREIIKVNLLPAAVIGFGLALLLFASGGTANPIHYLIIPLSILAMSVFFSVHYLTCYYLLQPYNVNTEIKSATYPVVTWITYMVCFVLMQVRMDALVFGVMASAFCILYCIVACILVYKLAYKTFRLRS